MRWRVLAPNQKKEKKPEINNPAEKPMTFSIISLIVSLYG